MVRRPVLEAEVRRELAIERAIALKKALVGDQLVFQDPTETLDNHVGISCSSPLSIAPQPPEPSPHNLEVFKELTSVSKPKPDLSGLKRKIRSSTGGNEIIQYSVRKKKKMAKKEWSCAMCQVTLHTERALEEHLNGKRHKASEKILRAEILGKNLSNAPNSKNDARFSKESETTAAASSQSEVKDKRVSLEAIDGSDKKDTDIVKGKTSKEKQVELPVQKDQCGEGSRNNVEVKTVHIMQRKEEPTK